jgi:hypothetical protein
MKWQNLIRRECPVCDSPLKIIDRKEKYECSDPGCNFTISRWHMAELIADKNHQMRKFLTKDELKIIRKAERAIYNNV